MTTAAFTRQGTATATLPHYHDEHIVTPGIEEQALAIMAISASMAIEKEVRVNDGRKTGRLSMEARAYLANKFGDDDACADELGFESTCMGLRADHNHIF